jgi:hypothetical protein
MVGRPGKSELERTWQEVFLPNMWYCAGICLKGLTTAGWLVSRLKLIPGPYKCQVVLLAAPTWTFSNNIHWTEHSSPVNITPLHAWDTVLDQCGGSALLIKVFAVLDDLLQANCQNSTSVPMLLLLMLLSWNIHKHLQSVLNNCTVPTIGGKSPSWGQVWLEWVTMWLCTVLQDLISESGFATVYSVVKQNVAHMSVQNLLLCWSLKSFCIYWSWGN